MADGNVKALTSEIDCPTFDQTAFTTPPPLAEATVAIVTSASLHHPEQDDFVPGDTTVSGARRDRHDYVPGHWSPNFDACGFASDTTWCSRSTGSTSSPTSGRIGRVADQHLAYAGNQFDLSAIRLDSGPPARSCCRSTASTSCCSPPSDRSARVP